MIETIITMWEASSVNFICLTVSILFFGDILVTTILKGVTALIHGWPPNEEEVDDQQD